MNKQEFFKELYNLYGPVTRARNCYLYTKKGVRLTDLYQEDGRAILGWEGSNAFTQLKNVLNRSQVGSFICEDHNRVEKAVSQLLVSNRKVLYFSNKVEALKAGIRYSPYKTAVYIPWNENKIDWSDIDSVIIQPPLPWTDSVYILALKTPQIQSSIPISYPTQKSITLPFALEVGIARSIYNLIEALQIRKEINWFIYDTVLTKYWIRKGPYLQPKVPEEKYSDFVIHCLKLGIVINPDYNLSIVPFGADKGIFSKLKNSPFVY